MSCQRCGTPWTMKVNGQRKYCYRCREDVYNEFGRAWRALVPRRRDYGKRPVKPPYRQSQLYQMICAKRGSAYGGMASIPTTTTRDQASNATTEAGGDHDR